MTETQRLIERIEKEAERQNLAPSTLSFRLLGSGKTFSELQNGKTITLAKYERAMALLDDMERGEAA